MTSIKARAVEILQDIPDDKIFPVIEILKGLQILYAQDKKPMNNENSPANIMGICSKYANPNLISLEKEAWAEAVREKHAIN